jgi:hypothetical protein
MGEEERERIIKIAEKLYGRWQEQLLRVGLSFREFDALTNDEKDKWFSDARFAIKTVEAHPPVHR